MLMSDAEFIIEPKALHLHDVTPVTLEAADGSKWAFCPQSDISTLESTLITQLFIKLVMTVWVRKALDWETYLAVYNLKRHFVLAEPAPPAKYEDLPR